MATRSLDDHIEITPGIAGGRARIAGRRIKVQDIVVWHEALGKTVEQIADEYDLGLADVHAALAFYFDHREQVDKEIAADAAFVQALRAQTPSKLEQKLHGRPH